MADDHDDDGNPLEGFGMFGMPMFGDLSKMMAGQGPLNWDAARQFALLSASGDPDDRAHLPLHPLRLPERLA